MWGVVCHCTPSLPPISWWELLHLFWQNLSLYALNPLILCSPHTLFFLALYANSLFFEWGLMLMCEQKHILLPCTLHRLFALWVGAHAHVWAKTFSSSSHSIQTLCSLSGGSCSCVSKSTFFFLALYTDSLFFEWGLMLMCEQKHMHKVLCYIIINWCVVNLRRQSEMSP